MDGLALSSFGMSPEEFPALTRNARETMGGLFEVDRSRSATGMCWKFFRTPSAEPLQKEADG